LDISLPGSYHENKTHWAEVAGSDCHNFRGNAVPGSRYTWVKMASPSLEGLRFALLDGNDISLQRWDATDFKPFEPPEHFIEEISIEQARYMGRGNPETLRFSPYFNALIGGRGTGKSTIVHALRLAYDRKSELDVDGFDGKSGPLYTFNEFNRLPQDRHDRGGLQTQTQITATLVRDGRGHRLRWKQQDGQDVIVVEELDGENWRESISQTVNPERFPLRLFSQGQIASMADENRQGLLSVIDEAANVQPKKQGYEEAIRAFSSLRAQLRELEAKLTGRDEIRRKLEDVQRKIQSFEQTQYSEALKSFQRAHRQRSEVETQFEHFSEWVERIGTFADEILLDNIPAGTFDDVADADALEVLASLRQALTESGQNIQAIANGLKRIEQNLRSDARLQAWHERVAAREAQYEELKSTLAAQGVTDPSQYASLLQERQSLQTQAAELDALSDQREVFIERIQKQEQIILEARREITAARQRFLEANLENNPYVHIKIEPFGYDPQTLERSLRECLDIVDDRFQSDILEMDGDKPNGGLIAKLLSRNNRLVALEGVRQKLLDVSDNFNGRFQTHLQRKLSTQPEFADRIQTWFPEDDLRIEYSQKGDSRDFKSITQGSAGQRAAAILAFLLAFGEEPIVLDQPEDDLDNHLIYDLVVQQIRANKLRRQLIIVTHNPNIVVNGDAEMIHALDFGGSQCFVRVSGALQEESVRDEVCRIMEGGQDAFARRWHRLGKEL
jgi:energy-coupling factor transporter ATP-binding protein EcfA2